MLLSGQTSTLAADGQAEASRAEPSSGSALLDKAIANCNGTCPLNPQGNDLYKWNAIDEFSEVIRVEPTNARAYLCRGVALLTKRANARAIDDFSEHIRLDPQNVSAYVYRGFAYVRKCDYANAIADYSEAIRLNPVDADVYFDRGVAWQMKSDYKKALADYEQAIARNRSRPG